MSDQMQNLHTNYIYHMHQALKYKKEILKLQEQHTQQWHQREEIAETLRELKEVA